MGIIDHASDMTIIEVLPSEKFKGAWVAFEAPGVKPAFAAPDAKRKRLCRDGVDRSTVSAFRPLKCPDSL